MHISRKYEIREAGILTGS